MSKRLFKVLLVSALFLLLGFSSQVFAVPGDCDGNGVVNAPDIVYLTTYLFMGGPPPPIYDDCDCDGFEGVNFGDLQQLTNVLFTGGTLFAPPGSDLLTVSQSGIMISRLPNGVDSTIAYVFMNNPVALNGGLTLPFSFAKKAAGDADLIATTITIGPAFVGLVNGTIDNPAKVFYIDATGAVPSTPNWELLCTVTFALDPGGTGPGTPVRIEGTAYQRLFPLLITTPKYNGTDYVRMEMPRYIPDSFITSGNADCGGGTSIGDAVYIINWIFGGGPSPSDPDNDGTPECPAP